jgi:hypothetical protein
MEKESNIELNITTWCYIGILHKESNIELNITTWCYIGILHKESDILDIEI